MDTQEAAFVAVLLLSIFYLVGYSIRKWVPSLEKWSVPISLISGFVALIFSSSGALGFLIDEESSFSFLLVSSEVVGFWRDLPGFLINFVFACLFLGKTIPSIPSILKMAGPQALFSHTMAWGQYALGALVVGMLLVPVLGANELTGALIEVSFLGGHGTVGGLQSTFNDLDFAEGYDIAIALATIGVLGAVSIGPLMVQLGRKRGWTSVNDSSSDSDDKEQSDNSDEAQKVDFNVSTLVFHFSILFLCVAAAYGLAEALIWFESALRSEGEAPISEALPVFPLAMITGIILQLVFMKFKIDRLLKEPIFDQFGDWALAFLIIAALGSLDLDVVGGNLLTIVILSGVAIGWNVFALLVLAKHMLPKEWFERGVADYGQAMGMTVTGLLLIQMVDPDTKTKTKEAFGYKQILFEPLVGGGLVTATSMLILSQLGLLVFGIITAAITTGFLVAGLVVKKKLAR